MDIDIIDRPTDEVDEHPILIVAPTSSGKGTKPSVFPDAYLIPVNRSGEDATR